MAAKQYFKNGVNQNEMTAIRYTGSEFPRNIISPGRNYILWLASWYPTKTIPFNGDFIQRHALATSLYHQVVVVHTIHDPHATTELYYDVTVTTNLAEIILYFRDAGPGKSLLDKLRYNFSYFRQTKRFIRHLFKEYSSPVFVHVHVPMKMGKIALWIKQRWNINYMVSEHDASYLKSAPDNYFKRSLYYRGNVSRIFSKAIAVTNVSEAVGRILRLTFPIKRFFIVRNTVDTRFFYHHKKLKPGFRFIHVSTMNYQKNIEGLLRVFERIASEHINAELMLTGPVSVDLRKLVKDSSAASRISISGEVPYEQVAAHMQDADCLVLFSRYENFPCVIIEGLSCGLPVITSDAGGAGEGIHQNNGIVVPSEDEVELFAAMKKMIQYSEHYQHEAISTEAHALYGFERIGMEFHDIYRSLELI